MAVLQIGNSKKFKRNKTQGKTKGFGNICEIDPCYFPKFCNFCNAINNAGLLDKKSEQQSLTITSNNNPKIGGGWIQGLKDHQSIIKKNF